MRKRRHGARPRTVFLLGSGAAFLLWTVYGPLFVPTELYVWALGRAPDNEWERLSPAILALVGATFNGLPVRLFGRLSIKDAAVGCAVCTALSVLAGAILAGWLGLFLATAVAAAFGSAGRDLTINAVTRDAEQGANRRYAGSTQKERGAQVKRAIAITHVLNMLSQGVLLFAPGPATDQTLKFSTTSTYLVLLAVGFGATAALIAWRCPAPSRGLERPSQPVDLAQLYPALLVSATSMVAMTLWDGLFRQAAEELGIGRTASAWMQCAFLVGAVVTAMTFLVRRPDGEPRLGINARLVIGTLATVASFVVAYAIVSRSSSPGWRALGMFIGRVFVESGTTITSFVFVALYVTSTAAQSWITAVRGASQLAGMLLATWLWGTFAVMTRLVPPVLVGIAMGVIQISAVAALVVLTRVQQRRSVTARVVAWPRGSDPILLYPAAWTTPERAPENQGLVAGTAAGRPQVLTLEDWRRRKRHVRRDRRPRDLEALRAAIDKALDPGGYRTAKGEVRVWRTRNGGHAAYAQVSFGSLNVPGLAQFLAAVRARFRLEHMYLGPIAGGSLFESRGVVMQEALEKDRVMTVLDIQGVTTVLIDRRDEDPEAWERGVLEAWYLQDQVAVAGLHVDVLTVNEQRMASWAADGHGVPAEFNEPYDEAQLRAEIAKVAGHSRLAGDNDCNVTLFWAGPQGLIAHVGMHPRRSAAADLLARQAADNVAKRFPMLGGVLVGAAE